MNFELSNYHRNIPNQTLLLDVRDTAKRLGKNSLTVEDYLSNGHYSPSTVIRRFGSWKVVLEKCDLETKGHNFKFNVSDDIVIDDLQSVAKKLQTKALTQCEYDKYGNYSSSTLVKKYTSWSNVLKMAGLKCNSNRKISTEEMFKEIERIWIILGRQPTTTDIKNGISTISLQSFTRRFGGWRNALSSFLEYIEKDNCSNGDSFADTSYKAFENSNYNIPKKKTNRDINLRLRFKVLSRDHFTCCLCGASPAKDPSVELHVDHIIPWSKGGETVEENLQTLCSKCNLGKSDFV